MAKRERARDRGVQRGRTITAALGNEFREARIGAGLSQHDLARASGLSQSRISRTERGRRTSLSIEEAALHAEVLGLRLHVRGYPAASPVRDAAQLRLLDRLRHIVGGSFRWRTEVPIMGGGDLRAWDAVLDRPGDTGVEAETRLHDVQATQRRIELKLRDGDASVAILLVADTHHNRHVLREHRAALASTFPADTRETLEAIRRGRAPARSGIVVL